jgi:hypothetical protein
MVERFAKMLVNFFFTCVSLADSHHVLNPYVRVFIREAAVGIPSYGWDVQECRLVA